jgi:hypothetical protein
MLESPNMTIVSNKIYRRAFLVCFDSIIMTIRSGIRLCYVIYNYWIFRRLLSYEEFMFVAGLIFA